RWLAYSPWNRQGTRWRSAAVAQREDSPAATARSPPADRLRAPAPQNRLCPDSASSPEYYCATSLPPPRWPGVRPGLRAGSTVCMPPKQGSMPTITTYVSNGTHAWVSRLEQGFDCP